MIAYEFPFEKDENLIEINNWNLEKNVYNLHGLN